MLRRLIISGNGFCCYIIFSPLRRSLSCKRSFSLNPHFYNKQDERQLMIFQDFETKTDKSKEAFLDVIRTYENRHIQRRGHVEFIYAAMKHMKHFGVEKDLKAYKALIDVMPKGKFIPTNIFQVEFMHYPKQQQCIIDLLEQMEDNGVIPDSEMEPMLLNIFGSKGFPLRKYWRMMYWMPKFKNLSPWKVPNPAPDDAFELAKLAIERITSVDLATVIDVFQCEEIEESLDKTWVVTGQSSGQLKLLEVHPANKPIIVEAGGRVWLRSKSINYFVLKSDPEPEEIKKTYDDDDVSNLKIPFFSNPATSEIVETKTVHEQEDGTIYGVCCTGTSSKDSALSWIRILQKHKCPRIDNLTVLFRFRTPSGDIVPYSDVLVAGDKKESSNESI